jgi:hypothetical protein
VSEAKTTLELARIFEEEYAKITPFKKNLEDKVEEVFKTIKAFLKKNKWNSREGKFYWVTTHYSVHIDESNITPEGIYFGGNGWEDDDFISFEDMDNIDAVLVREFEAYVAEMNEQKAKYETHKRARLEAELAALNN